MMTHLIRSVSSLVLLWFLPRVRGFGLLPQPHLQPCSANDSIAVNHEPTDPQTHSPSSSHGTRHSSRFALRLPEDWQGRSLLRGGRAERCGSHALLPPEEAGDHDEGLDVGVRGGELAQQGDVVEGLVIVEEGDDAQAHCAQQEYPVPPHFHPGGGGMEGKSG